MSTRSRRSAPGRSLLVLSFMALLLCPRGVHALTYHFIDGSPLCFSETIEDTKDAQITGTYEWVANPAYPSQDVRLRVTVTDRSERVFYAKKLIEGEHTIAVQLTPDVEPGEMLICFMPSSTFVASEAKPLKFRVQLDQAQGSRVDPEKEVVETIRKRRQVGQLDVFTYRDVGGELKDILQPRVYLERLDSALRAMERALDRLVADLDGSVNRESRMRQTSESTFTRVWVCAVLLIAVISGVLWMEFRFLKSTLRKKKLV